MKTRQAIGWPKLLALLALLPTAVSAAENHHSAKRPIIVWQPQSQTVATSGPVEFFVRVESEPPEEEGEFTYQWQMNSNATAFDEDSPGWVDLPGKNEPTNTLFSVSRKDVGWYRVKVSWKHLKGVTNSEPASLCVYDSPATKGNPITVYGPPVVTPGSGSGCPSVYAGYVNYKKALPDWGWIPATTNCSAIDGITGTNRIEICGSSGDRACGTNYVSIVPGAKEKYRFTIYFPSTVPSINPYPIILNGFNP